MTERLAYPVADCLAVFAWGDGGTVAIHSRNVCGVVPLDAQHAEISTADGMTRTVVATLEVVMQRLGGREI